MLAGASFPELRVAAGDKAQPAKPSPAAKTAAAKLDRRAPSASAASALSGASTSSQAVANEATARADSQPTAGSEAGDGALESYARMTAALARKAPTAVATMIGITMRP